MDNETAQSLGDLHNIAKVVHIRAETRAQVFIHLCYQHLTETKSPVSPIPDCKFSYWRPKTET